MHTVDARRLGSALRQAARKCGSAQDVEEAISTVSRIIELCGPGSSSKQMAFRIGLLLLRQPQPTILVPVCPDYSHEDGLYTFKGLGSGVPLLAKLHVSFLEQVRMIVPSLSAVFLIADQESEDAALCRSVGLTQDAFLQQVTESALATHEFVDKLGWKACAMSTYVPELKVREANVATRMSQDPSLHNRIQTETMQRASMYRRIDSLLTYERMRERTIRTAAQYVVMGEFAERNGLGICNHTTVNLSWYLKTEVALLHNPISVY